MSVQVVGFDAFGEPEITKEDGRLKIHFQFFPPHDPETGAPSSSVLFDHFSLVLRKSIQKEVTQDDREVFYIDEPTRFTAGKVRQFLSEFWSNCHDLERAFKPPVPPKPVTHAGLNVREYTEQLKQHLASLFAPTQYASLEKYRSHNGLSVRLRWPSLESVSDIVIEFQNGGCESRDPATFICVVSAQTWYPVIARHFCYCRCNQDDVCDIHRLSPIASASMDVRKPDRFSPFYGEGLGSPEPFANTIHQLYGERFLPWFETYNDPRAFERLLNDLPWSSIPTLSNLTDCQGTQDVESGRGQFFDRALLGLISSRIYAPQRFNDLKESYRKKISKSCWPEQWGNDIEPHLVYLETII